MKEVDVTYRTAVPEGTEISDFKNEIKLGDTLARFISAQFVEKKTRMKLEVVVDVPPEYTHVAIDEDGNVYAFKRYPEISSHPDVWNFWRSDIGEETQLKILNWKETVVKVPE